jgi:3-isopropylmalate/(R)-2-methylmalate dehydratase small subunit
MEKFIRYRGVTAALLQSNIDTDAIIPSREMKRVSKFGLGEGLFAGWRYLAQDSREPNMDFILNQPAYAGTSILLGGDNFGCGSSREHAVWALREYGIRAIVAPGYGAIFANNCIRNGLLPIVLDEADIKLIADWVAEEPALNQLEIDLPAQNIVAGRLHFNFSMDRGEKQMLVEGLDAIALTQTRNEQITAFHRQRQQQRPWLYNTL